MLFLQIFCDFKFLGRPQILANIVAFLAFMALKVKPKVSPKLLTLVDYN